VDGDADTLHRLRTQDFSLDFVHGDAFDDHPITGDEAREFWPVWVSAFCEIDYEIARTIAAPDVVVIQWVFSGKHCHEIGKPVFSSPVPPSGRAIRLRGISVFDIVGNAIQKETIYIDQATLMLELDAIHE
jgi:predicted ester cyclase